MMHSRVLLTTGTLAACLLFVSTAAASGGRAGHADLLFGAGTLQSQEVTLFDPITLHGGDGTVFDLRFRFHFTNNIGIEVGGSRESETTELKDTGFTTDSGNTNTGFVWVNALFHLIDSRTSPYVAIGGGSYSHSGTVVNRQTFFLEDVHESGGLFDLAAGIDGRGAGRLVWAFEARYLQYSFDGFSEDWRRWQFSGHLGFHF